MFDLARQLVDALPLSLEHHSKAERGYALYSAHAAVPVKARAVRLGRTMDAGAAFHVIVASALAQVQGNVRGLLDSDDPEFLHQMLQKVSHTLIKCEPIFLPIPQWMEVPRVLEMK